VIVVFFMLIAFLHLDCVDNKSWCQAANAKVNPHANGLVTSFERG